MTDSAHKNAAIANYELEVAINASADAAWSALINNIGDWWLPDFHLVDPNSTVTFEPRPGGHLTETLPNGEGLLWFTVQWINSEQHKMYVIGHISPDWGGPATYSLKMWIESTDNGCVFRASDSHVGNVDDKNLGDLKSGWTMLFSDGLKKWVEAQG